MSDNWFLNQNSSKIDEMSIQEDDPDFDLLNEETFGSNLISDDDDWEAQHEHLTHEYIKENHKEPANYNQQNYEAKDEEVDTNGISEQMVQFVLSENEARQEAQPRQDNFGIFGPFVSLSDAMSQIFEEREKVQDDTVKWLPWITPPAPPTQSPAFPNMRTVEEIERELTKPNAVKNASVTTKGAASQPSKPVLPRSSTPKLTIPGGQLNYNILPLPTAPPKAPQQPQHPPPTIIQTRPLSMMNSPMVQPMPINFAVPMQPRFPPAAAAGVGGGPLQPRFMPLNAARPPLMPPQPNQRFQRDDFQRGDVRARQQGLEFQNRRQVPRGGRGPHHFEPFVRGQEMYRPQNASRMFDEYANLMTDHEKHWLAQIQQYQLNNMSAKQDYYYTTYMSRKQGSSNRKNNNFAGNSRSARETTPKPAYAPLQFENSLGKLQVGSVLAPRKIIDIDVVENVESSNQPVVPTTKQLLMEIESMFNYVLKMEECDALGVDCTLVPDADKIAEHMMAHKRFIPYMNFHKGRHFMCRLLPFVSNTCPIMNKMVGSMVALSKKCNGDDVHLLSFLPYIRCWLATITLNQLVDIAMQVESSISYLLTNKFTISVLASMVERADHIFEETGETNPKWDNFIMLIVKQIQSEGGQIERPVVGVDSLILRRHLTRCTKMKYEMLTVAIKTLCHN